MNDRLEQINTDMKNVALTATEKTVIRQTVISYMDANPIEEGILSPYIEQRGWSWADMFQSMKLHYAPLALIVVLLFGSAVSAAAEETVPGDTLYFVKTNINENVKGWLALSHESKVRLEGQVALTRLVEAEKLTVQKKLSPAVKTQLEAKFKTHADNFKVGIKELESKGKLEVAAGVSSQFESSLNGHENILAALGENDPGGENATLAQSVALKVREEATVMTDVRSTIEDKVRAEATATSTEASARLALKTFEKNAADLQVSLEDSKQSLSAGVVIEVEDELRDVQRIITRANVRLENEKFADAFILYQRADRTTQEIKTIIDTNKELEVETTALESDMKDPGSVKGATTTAATTTPPLNLNTASTTASTSIIVSDSATTSSTTSLKNSLKARFGF